MILLACLMLCSLYAISQQSRNLSVDEWVGLITKNAVAPGKTNASLRQSGFALYFTQAGNIRVPYIVYVPKSYNPATAQPAVVFLHGAILAKDSFQYKDPEIANEPVFSVADALHTIIIFPFARQDFKWSGQQAAFENILTIITQVERDYNIDKKKIYIGGISMGGNATYWFINHKPDLFAGFYTFSAMPRSGSDPIKFSNLTKDKPLYSLNAKDDPVFPYSEAEAAYEQHKAEAPGWHFNVVESGGHRFIYNPGGEKHIKTLLTNLLSH